MMPAGCHHGCDVENVDYEPEWPSDWSEFDKLRFRLQCVETGFVSEANDETENTIIILAYELDKANSDLDSLRSYLDETNALGQRVVELMRTRVNILVGIGNIISSLTPKPSTPLIVAIIKMIGLILAFMPLMMVAMPVRIWFKWRVKRVQKKMIPLFTTWIEERQQSTRTQLRKVISDRIDQEVSALEPNYQGESGPQGSIPQKPRRESATSRYLRCSEEDSDDGSGWDPVELRPKPYE